MNTKVPEDLSNIHNGSLVPSGEAFLRPKAGPACSQSPKAESESPLTVAVPRRDEQDSPSRRRPGLLPSRS